MKPLNNAQVKALNLLLGTKFCLCNNGLILFVFDRKPQDIIINIDKTATEALYNHIHFENLIHRDIEFDIKKEFVEIIMNTLYLRLKNEFPNKKFRIYVEIENTCLTIRFTQIHHHEENWANEKDCINQINSGNLFILSD